MQIDIRKVGITRITTTQVGIAEGTATGALTAQITLVEYEYWLAWWWPSAAWWLLVYE